MEDSTFSFIPDNQEQNSMQFMEEGPAMQFEPLREGPAKIKVIGVGGGGGNAVNHMYRQGIHGVEFIVCNTDAKALEASPVPNKIVLGKLGAGNVPERAKQLALEHKEEIKQAISNDTQMLFITAGMGGGTGTGAAPVIAEIAKSIELDDDMVKRILVVAIVTEPFSFEGSIRRNQAAAGIEELKKHVDAILVINNDKLRKYGDVPLKQAFSKADDVLLTAAKGIAEIITVSAYVNIDFRDVNTVMEKSGTALMGAGFGSGEDRAQKAIETATTSVLLNDNDIRGAKNILLYFSCSPEKQITMDELGTVTDYITKLTGNNGANVIWGIGDDDSLNDELHITLIATGFEPLPGVVIHELDKVDEATPKAPENNVRPAETVVIPRDVHEQPVDESGMHIVHKATTAMATEVANAAVEASHAEVPQQPQATVPQSNGGYENPFDTMPTNQIGNRRYITLESPAVEEVEEPVAVELPAEEPVQVASNSHLDEIRVFSKPRVQQTAEPVKQEPVFHIQHTEVFEAPAPVEAHQLSEQQTAEQQIARAFTPRTEESIDMKVRERAERIKRLNDMLLNDPDGPRKVEDMTTAQLTDEPIFESSHSSESDAARTQLRSDGSFGQGIRFLEDLPD
ncbi:MAG: cell division protein FtsZ [Bacteroidales bacterium]|nr:cell division protein FtsZ [Bacteroidales bacterium]